MKVALYTYNTKPRGGVVHTLALAEALVGQGCAVTVYALGHGGSERFYREVRADTTVFPFPAIDGEAFEAKIERSVQAFAAALAGEPLGSFDVHHVQDCISANSLHRLQEKGLVPSFLRTVHHLDDFTTPALVECQRRSVVAPRELIVVSDTWRDILRRETGRDPAVIHNGVDERFFRPPDDVGADDGFTLPGRVVLFTLGGIEPRKNTIATLHAFAKVKAQVPEAELVIGGGATLFDYRPYRAAFDEALERLPPPARDAVRIVSSPDDAAVRRLYRRADVYLQPSLKEGWGLSVLEAMASGTPVVASDIPVFREFMTDGSNALLADPADPDDIASAVLRVLADGALRERIAANGVRTAQAYTWPAAAERHLDVYRRGLDDERAARIGGTYR